MYEEQWCPGEDSSGKLNQGARSVRHNLGIRKLREAVEAGDLNERDPFLAVFDREACNSAFDAYYGSVDAALALKKAVLPGWPVAIHDMTPDYLGALGWDAKVNWPHTVWQPTFTASGPFAYEGRADTPARALLLAILRAMEAQE